MKKTFQIQPSTNMMDVLAYSGYTFDSAIADIIDNSISAHAKNIDIFFEIINERIRLYILDDGDGMDIEKLHQCVIPAYQDINHVRKKDDLGRYSLGLKSASRSFCKQLYICSKEKNKCANTVELDFEYIKNNNIWEAFELDDFEFSSRIIDKGTLVLWDNVTFKSSRLDNLSIYDKFDKLEVSLSHVFGKYILSNKINIYIQSSTSKNKIKIKGWNPFELPENKSTKIISRKTLTLNNKEIIVNSYILPIYSKLSQTDQLYMKGNGLIEQQGFYVYRNDRLIQEGGWLDLENITADHKCEYARIEVLIGNNLDREFDINFSKCKVSIPQELTRDFLEIAKYARKNSKTNYDYMKDPTSKKKIKKESNIPVWNTYRTSDGLKLSINTEHPIVQDVLSKLSIRDSSKLLRLITNTIPVSFIQTQGALEEKYDPIDITFLISETFDSLYKKEHDVKLIKKQMFKIEPFNMYPDLLIDFFLKKEEE